MAGREPESAIADGAALAASLAAGIGAFGLGLVVFLNELGVARLAAIAGGVCTLLLFSLADPHGQSAMDGVALLGGALAGIGVERFFRR